MLEALTGDDIEEDEEGNIKWHGRVRADSQQTSALILTASTNCCRLYGTGHFPLPTGEIVGGVGLAVIALYDLDCDRENCRSQVGTKYCTISLGVPE